MRINIFSFLFIISVLPFSLNGYVLGTDTQKSQEINSNNTILWSYKDQRWSASKPLEKFKILKKHLGDDIYVLVNGDKNFHSTSVHPVDTYDIKKGWNVLNTPKNGVDVIKSFQNHADIEFVYTYDERSKAWAGYSTNELIRKEMGTTRILSLKYIEPNRIFYVFSSKKKKVNIKSTQINMSCQKAIKEHGYKVLIDSGLDEDIVYDERKTVGVSSRYLAHHKRGIYDDTRVALIYKELDRTSSEHEKYGIASPKMFISFPKERGDSYFFVFDYKLQECFVGAYPSEKVPPYSSLRKVK